MPVHSIKISVLGQIFFRTARHNRSLQDLAVHLMAPHNRISEDHFVHPHPARQPSGDERLTTTNNHGSWLEIIAEEEELCTEREEGGKVFCCRKGGNIVQN